MVNSTNSVNTTIEGTYILDYTAPSDMAGNPGSTISRTVTVFDTPPLELIRNLITSSHGSEWSLHTKITLQSRGIGSVNTSRIGVYTFDYRATRGYGR